VFNSGSTAPGTVTLTCQGKNAAGSTGAVSTPTTSMNVVAGVGAMTITPAALTVTAGAGSLTATCVASGATSYSWQISGGTANSATNTSSLTYTAGSAGTLQLTCTASNSATTPQSVTGTQNVTVIAAAGVATVVGAPTTVTTGAGSLTANCLSANASSYLWNITGGGTINSGGTTNQITFTAGAAGTLTLTCQGQNALNATGTLSGVANVTVLPAVGAATVSGTSATVTANTTLTATCTSTNATSYVWTLGGTSGGAILGGQTGATLVFNSGSTAPGTVTLTCQGKNAAGSTGAVSTPTTSMNVVAGVGPMTITPAALTVTAGAGSLTATCVASGATSYSWQISGGTANSATNMSSLTYTAGSAGTLQLTCTASNSATTPQSVTGTQNVTVIAAAGVATISGAPTTVTAGTIGLTATCAASNAATYAWTLSGTPGGTITSLTNISQITFTAGGPAAGTLTLSCAGVNSVGTSGTASSLTTINVAAAAASASGSFGGPFLVIDGKPITFTLPTFNAATTTAFIQVAGSNVTPDIHSAGTSYILTETPTTTTTFSLVGYNAAGSSTAMGSVTVHVAGSFSGDSLASALYGSAAAAIGGSGAHAGQILIIGGASTAATPGSNTALPTGSTATYFFNPNTGTITTGPTMTNARAFHTATAFAVGAVGKILIAGGAATPTTSAFELYDDTAGTISVVGTNTMGICLHSAVLLDPATAAIGLFGGTDCTATNAGLTTVAIVNGVTGVVVSPVGSGSNGQLTVGRAAPTAVLLGATNKVLIAGGYTTNAANLASADIFTYVSATPSTSSTAATGTMTATAGRSGATSTLYTASTCDGAGGGDCKVLVAGGNGAATHTAEIYTYHSGAGTFAATTNEMNAQRQYHAAALISSTSGLVLLAGGLGATVALKSTEVFDPSSSSFYTAAPMALSRQQFSATIVPGSSPVTAVLAGGSSAVPNLVEAETVTP